MFNKKTSIIGGLALLITLSLPCVAVDWDENPATNWKSALNNGASLYKIMSHEEFKKMERVGFSPSEFDKQDGPKIHLSVGNNWKIIQKKFFNGAAVVVVKFKPETIIPALVHESNRSDGDFCMSYPITNDLSVFNEIKEVLFLNAFGG